MEYTIIGYYPEHGWWALVALAGHDKDEALKKLYRMVINPTDNDKELIGKATVLSIDTVKSEDAWWNDPFLAN